MPDERAQVRHGHDDHQHADEDAHPRHGLQEVDVEGLAHRVQLGDVQRDGPGWTQYDERLAGDEGKDDACHCLRHQKLDDAHLAVCLSVHLRAERDGGSEAGEVHEKGGGDGLHSGGILQVTQVERVAAFAIAYKATCKLACPVQAYLLLCQLVRMRGAGVTAFDVFTLRLHFVCGRDGLHFEHTHRRRRRVFEPYLPSHLGGGGREGKRGREGGGRNGVRMCKCEARFDGATQ
mmetsp:Transcript_1741/g.3662  ORF Transcript_1741/g.3662 Transcript_1741/m.3662 type:complete len:234 (+) Transcript_1741:2733-3434(+)